MPSVPDLAATQMVERAPGAKLVTVADVGHAPTLEEPEAVKAIDMLLAKVAKLQPAA